MQVEVFLMYDKQMLQYFSEDKFYEKEFDISGSIIKRHGIKHMIEKKELADFDPESINYLDNLLLSQDDLLPGEVIIDKSCADQYLKLSDFQIKEENICLVDTIEKFQQLVKQIAETKP